MVGASCPATQEGCVLVYEIVHMQQCGMRPTRIPKGLSSSMSRLGANMRQSCSRGECFSWSSRGNGALATDLGSISSPTPQSQKVSQTALLPAATASRPASRDAGCSAERSPGRQSSHGCPELQMRSARRTVLGPLLQRTLCVPQTPLIQISLALTLRVKQRGLIPRNQRRSAYPRQGAVNQVSHLIQSHLLCTHQLECHLSQKKSESGHDAKNLIASEFR